MESRQRELEELMEYRLLETREIRELNAVGYILEHKKCGAKVFLMDTDDDNKVFFIREEETPEPPAVSIYYADIETGQPVRLENGGNRGVMDFAITWEGDSFFVGTWKGGNYIISKADFYLDNYEAARPGGY